MKSILSLIRVTTVCHAFYVTVSLILIGVAEVAAQISNANPRLLFTDLESGPNTGGQDNLGAFITLYGEGFGATRGSSTVTIGGVEVAKYVTWGQDNGIARSLDMIVVQPGPNVASGNISVTVNGKASNPLPFAVRIGSIYFVIPGAPNADDTNPGTYAAPFKTIYRPRQVMLAGDIVYLKGGIFSQPDPGNPGWDAILMLRGGEHASGTAARPVAYLGYPGESPVLGSSSARRGFLMLDGGLSYYVIGNLTFTQAWEQLPLSGIGHRVIGNYFHDGAAVDGAAIGIVPSSQIKVFGNLLRRNGEPGNKLVHGLYIQGFGTVSDIDFGWNQVQDHQGGRAIQLYGHQAGDRMDNIRIHDNVISGSELNNITLGGSDGGTEVIGTIYFYNNIVVGSGTEGLRVNDPQGTFYIQNNTFYNNGTSQIYLQRAGTGRVTLQNNILYAGSTGQAYYTFEPGGATSASFNASHNLVYNAGTCPAWDVGCVNADPRFVNLTDGDYRLQAGSPAIDAGVNTGISRDYVGIPRPQGTAYDIGAYEYSMSPTSVESRNQQSSLVDGFRLEQNYPNPFYMTTSIRYSLPDPAEVTLKIFDVLGHEVATLVNALQSSGYHLVEWKPTNLPKGVYRSRLVTRNPLSSSAHVRTEFNQLVLLSN